MIKLFYRPNADAGARLGISIGRKYGPAVRRNRFKRLVREAFRSCRHDLGDLDIIALPVFTPAEANLAAAVQDFEALIRATAVS